MSRLKIVPTSAPDADGRWIDVPTEVLIPGGSWWVRMMEAYMKYVPDGHFIVQYESVGGTRMGLPDPNEILFPMKERKAGR